MTAARPTPAVPEIRRMDFDFSGDIPRWWMHGDRVLTRNIDALHMLFPEGERFFIRSVRHYIKDITDPHLKARVKGFMGQEVMHGREHEGAFALLERDGLEYESFLNGPGTAFFKKLEGRFSPMTCLAITCALEHMTAVLGEGAFSDTLLDGVHPTMRHLALWHAAEEIEHKSVAFDVYAAMGGGYLRRMFGMVVAYTSLMWLWRQGTEHLLRQDGGYSAADMKALKRRMEARGTDRMKDVQRSVFDYMRPSFHPDDHDTAHLAAAYFAGRAAAAA